jgi:hypothetical protein
MPLHTSTCTCTQHILLLGSPTVAAACSGVWHCISYSLCRAARALLTVAVSQYNCRTRCSTRY